MAGSDQCCCPCLVTKPNRPTTGARVVLDVGGHKFTTARTTLTSGLAAGSVLAEVVCGPCEQDGAYFLDRDGAQFNFILNYLRHGPDLFVAPEDPVALLTLLAEAKMLRLTGLAELLESKKLNGTPQDFPGVYTEAREYQGAPHPKNEAERIEKLRSLMVVDTQNTDTEYDNITRCVAAIFEVPICLVSLVTEDRQWFKSKCGLGADETVRTSSFCAYTLLPEGLEDARVLVVSDARHDIRFMKNPLVLGDPYIQFYAGCPLVTSEGLRLGSLCAIGRQPREVRPGEVGLLINFAHLTVQALEEQHLLKLQQELAEKDSDQEEEAEAEHDGELNFLGGQLRAEVMVEAKKAAVVLVWARADSMEWPLFFANKVFTQLTGVKVVAPNKFPGKPHLEAPGKREVGASLWDHVKINSCEKNKVMELWKMVAVAMKGRKQDTAPGYHAASVTVRHSSDGAAQKGKLTLSCRFTPAEVPLSETAAAVKNPGLLSTEKWPRPKGWSGDGHWFFVQMVPEQIDEPGPAPDSGLRSEPLAAAVPEAALPQPLPRTKSASAGNPAGATRSLAPGATVATKPPTAPFRDVKLVRLVGQGSFGSVYFSLWSGASVAVKIIKTVVPAGQEASEVDKAAHFEAVLSASISHPNLVQTFKHGGRMNSLSAESGNEAKSIADVHETWIVQEWCDGGTLRAKCGVPRLEGKGLLEALEMCIEISRAGQYLHDIGLIHGDLTGNNVLLKSMPVSKGYVCKVCDFGLARVLDGESQEIHTQTLGTVTHMPPELLDLAEKCALTQKADVYALGIISYHVFTGQEPYQGLTAPRVVLQVSRGKRPALPDVAPDRLVEIFQSMLMSNPADRPTFNDLIDQITGFYKSLGGVDDQDVSVDDMYMYRKSDTCPS